MFIHLQMIPDFYFFFFFFFTFLHAQDLKYADLKTNEKFEKISSLNIHELRTADWKKHKSVPH